MGCKGNYLKRLFSAVRSQNQPVGDDGSFPHAEAGITVQNINAIEIRHGG